MNVRRLWFLPLLFLFVLTLPDAAGAEKGGTPPEGKGKQTPVEVTVPKGNVPQKPDRAETPVQKEINPVAKEKRNVPTQQEKSNEVKELPEQASETAKEAVQKEPAKQKVDKVPVPSQSDQTVPVTAHKVEELDQPSASAHKQPEIIHNNSTTEETDTDTSNKDGSLSEESSVSISEEPGKSIPAPLPPRKDWEPTMLQVQQLQSQKKPSGNTGETKVPSKGSLDFLGMNPGEAVMILVEPFVSKHLTFRSQWVNAPPAPPPENTLSFFNR
ncbi:hypothetical protein LC085_08455 [Bacillus tianshenii]|uniref:hypothetical protein n=1 Tax=Sutcliffiella tianshenii TaxID=1463404 RepID=UPI001CD6B722|nr:hypothetical protein [Bacillus tianshenii]MCA1319945.1 hypothetical protein [Bacillus tianshenii]